MPDNSAVFADLSHHQAGVDLSTYRTAGHTRIALKATEGVAFTDPVFAARWRDAGQLGLARIAYHFARAKFDGADEFNHFWAVLDGAGGLDPNDRVCLDVEDSDTPDRAAANAREFVARAQATGVTEGLIYTYNYYATHHAIAPSQFPAGWRQLWLADYTAGQADSAIELGAGWNRSQVVGRQYTDKETVAGVPGTCDCSRVLADWLDPTTPVKPQEDDGMATWSDTDSKNLARVADAEERLLREGFMSKDTAGNFAPSAENYTVRGINNAQDITNAKLDALLVAVQDLPDAIAEALAVPPPPPPVA